MLVNGVIISTITFFFNLEGAKDGKSQLGFNFWPILFLLGIPVLLGRIFYILRTSQTSRPFFLPQGSWFM